MSKPSWPKLLACLLPLTFVAATCKRDQNPETDPVKVAAQSQPQKPATPAAANPTPAAPAELPTPTAGDLPGVPVEEIPEPAAKQLLAFAQDDFCYCGCPHTVQGCLKEHQSCRHAKRMILLGTAMAVNGAKSAQISTMLNQYYASFAADKRTTFSMNKVGCTGPQNAPVTLVEFSDFECPHCAAARPILEQLVQDQKGRVRLCYKPFPLSIHPHSEPAAEAAMFALEKGKFWEMHDLLFQNQGSLDVESLKSYATQLGLSGDELGKVIEEQKYGAVINSSREEGLRHGVTGTPAIFINGRQFNLPLSPEILGQTIDDEVEWQQNKGHWAQD